MSKYLCLCGRDFKRKKEANKHAEIYKDVQPENDYHIIVKKKWQGRLLDIALDYPWGKFFRVLGGFMILMVVEHHFKINFSMWESTFLGLGIGLYID